MKRKWIYLENPFFNATLGSIRLAVRISTYHDSNLYANSSDPEIAALYEIYHPIHLALLDAYDNWKSQKDIQGSQTRSLVNLLTALQSTQIADWVFDVSKVYKPKTAEFLKLFPHGRTPFNTGSQTDRISAVKTLSKTIGSDAALSEVKANIDNFYTNVDKANTSQKGSKGTTSQLSNIAEQKRLEMCIAQYSDLGYLMKKFADNTDRAGDYFDLVILRSDKQIVFTGNVKLLKARTIVKRKLETSTKIKIENPGVTVLQFYLAEVKAAKPGEIFVAVNPGDKVDIIASQLGNVANNYLMVYNPDELNKGEFDLEFI